MEKQLKHILLVDDSKATNFFNKMIIEKTGLAENVVLTENGAEALSYIDSTINLLNTPEIIFLDLNMPVMDGWEFLDHYNRLDYSNKNSVIILMLGTDLLPEDQKKVKAYNFIKGDSEKMLNKKFLCNLVKEHFNEEELVTICR